jgi:hypothetical protein
MVIFTHVKFRIPNSTFRILYAAAALLVTGAGVSAQTDLDAFMRQVLARRDDNWKKLQQYVLDERELIDIRGPDRTTLWGERREYTWYIRDGFFVRSPVKVNGVAVAEPERRKVEADYLKRQQARDRRVRAGEESGRTDAPDRGSSGTAAPQEPTPATGTDVDALLKQTRQPEFISSAYFLRFRFEEGKYALVGRETLDGRQVLRIEYYPTRLFRGTDRRRNQEGTSDSDRAYDAAFQRLMNKVALVTLWVEPDAHQIIKYTFNNLPVEFMPAQWLVHVDDLTATMTMGQPFPDVWLPAGLDFAAGLTLAIGRVDVHYGIEYHDYRRADVTTKIVR